MKTIYYTMSETLPHIAPRDLSNEIAALGDRYLGKGRNTDDFPNAKTGQVCYIPALRIMYEKQEEGWSELFFELSFISKTEKYPALYLGRLSQSNSNILQILLEKRIVFVNVPHWDETLTEKQWEQYFAVMVNANDLFGPMADSEQVTYYELPELMTYCFQYGFDKGPVYWMITKRREKPWERASSRDKNWLDADLVARCLNGELIID